MNPGRCCIVLPTPPRRAGVQRARRRSRAVSEVVQFVKGEGALQPADPQAKELLDRVGDGEYVLMTMRRVRNPQFHRKFMALLRLAFDHWNPAGRELAGMPARKSFERFRKELVINAGYYDVVLGIDGAARLEAKSIAWGKMGEETFTELYESMVSVLSQAILPGLTVPQANRLADEVLAQGF
jgi:hypothetical protein